jgi:hypothetical protein
VSIQFNYESQKVTWRVEKFLFLLEEKKRYRRLSKIETSASEEPGIST